MSPEPSRTSTPLTLRRGALLAALPLILMVSQCVCQNNRPDDPQVTAPDPAAPEATSPRGPALPAVLDVSDLDRDERQVLAELLAEQYDPCGQPRSFHESLEDPETCDLARSLGRMAVARVSQGLSKRQIAKVLRDEQARRASRATFDLSDAPAYGDPAKATRVVVEFFDFECPHCRTASEPSKALAREHGAVLYAKLLPLDHHDNARAAALGALAAHRQGLFWEAYAHLFDNQDALRAAPADSDIVAELLRDLPGLDRARWERDVKDPALAAHLARDAAEAERAGVNGTPSFFVDGYLVDYPALEDALSAP